MITVAAVNNNDFKAAEGIAELKGIRSSKSSVNWFVPSIIVSSSVITLLLHPAIATGQSGISKKGERNPS